MIKAGEWAILNSQFIRNMLVIVESTGALYSFVTLFDNGKEIAIKQVLTQDLKQAPIDNSYYEEELKYLINLALDTGDKEWFSELVNQNVNEHV